MPDAFANAWDEVLARLRTRVDTEDFRRWLDPSSYASDSGDQISVWVPTQAIRQHLTQRFLDVIENTLDAMGRGGTRIRFIVTGTDEDEEDADA
jgi:chromosomal replication initiation ATPase DnaA